MDLAERVRSYARAATERVRGLLPAEVRAELAASMRTLKDVRSPRQAIQTLETEAERLLTVVTPILVRHPLRVRTSPSAKAIVATAGGLAATTEELDEIAAFVTDGAALPPTLPLVFGANLLALIAEVYVTASLRVHDLRAAGVEPVPEDVAHDVLVAMSGEAEHSRWTQRKVTKLTAKSIAKRVARRWTAGLIPVAGIAYSAWDAQRSIAAIRSMPTSNDDAPPLPSAMSPAPSESSA